LKRLFTEGFVASDIAEPLLSFDAERKAVEVRRLLESRQLEVVGVRIDGMVKGFAVSEELSAGCCGDHMRAIEPGLVVDGDACLRLVMEMLDARQLCFVAALGEVGAVITKRDVGKPAVRMWLFGLVTIVEIFVGRRVQDLHPDGGWQRLLSAGRLNKAQVLLAERRRRNQEVGLFDCLQFSDKAQILLKSVDSYEEFGYASRREAARGIKDLESLRNNLAHSQDILTYNWQTIVGMARRLERTMSRI
jgi:hypothetical protein